MRIRFGVALAAMGMAWSVTAAAAPPLTAIADVIYKADGTRFNGIAIIEWKSFQAVDLSTIATHSVTVAIRDGVLQVRLVPTTNASVGAYYSVRYHSDGRIQFDEIWAVPPSSTTLRLKDVRVTSASPGVTVLPPEEETEISIADVVGLADELAARPSMGPGYAAGRTAYISETGLLEAVAGSPSDCVRVDGTAGPCAAAASEGIAFIDGETPAGVVDGSNGIFTLAGAPDPAESLTLYRNGIRQKAGLDFTLSETTIMFVPAATPQPGDVLVAAYRRPGAGYPVASAGGDLTGTYPSPSIASGVVTDAHVSPSAAIAESKLALNYPTHSPANDPTADQKAALAGSAGTPSAANPYVTSNDPRLAGGQAAQVLCSNTGSTTSSTTDVSLGSCVIPAGTLAAGDRVELFFSFTHTGSGAAPAFEVRWGATALVSRSATSSETRCVGRASVGLYQDGGEWEVQSWGATLSVSSSSGTLSHDYQSPLTVDILGRLDSATTDTLTLRNFSVIRFPMRPAP